MLINFNEDFLNYTRALHSLKEKYPDNYQLAHELADNFINIYNSIQETFISKKSTNQR